MITVYVVEQLSVAVVHYKMDGHDYCVCGGTTLSSSGTLQDGWP